jgi:hypothetical protein
MSESERDILITLMEKYDRNKIAQFLGINKRTLFNRLKNDSVLSKYIITRDQIDFTNLVELFRLGFSARFLANKYSCSTTLIRETLIDKMGKDEYKKTLNDIKQWGKNMQPEITEQNRLYLAEISDKLMNNKIDELSDELLVYAKILYQNGFITKKGEVTQEGKDALYH